ncbi:unnamed protein product [marine sediment metagenome]|jgi:hypothetical protein|uniref:Uncharacterized protein n=1 Tax=marine sediment metagenome TaxID=412755 RepID=X1C3F0_9ZZZZ
MCATCDMIRGLLLASGVSAPTANAIADSAPVVSLNQQATKKVKRKVSKYQNEFGKQLKKLKKKHPKTQVGTLMKRAHKLTKKLLK